MIAARALADRGTKLAFAFVTIAACVAFAIQPAPHARVVVTDTVVEILDDVTFVGDAIAPASRPTLDAIARTLDGNPSIQLVEVQADSLVRARACVDYLIGKGIAPERLDVGVKAGRVAAFLIVVRGDETDSQP